MITVDQLVPGNIYHYRWMRLDESGKKVGVADWMMGLYAREKKAVKYPDDPHGKGWKESNWREVPAEGDLQVVAVIGSGEFTKVLYNIVGDEELYTMDSEEMEWIINDGAS